MGHCIFKWILNIFSREDFSNPVMSSSVCWCPSLIFYCSLGRKAPSFLRENYISSYRVREWLIFTLFQGTSLNNDKVKGGKSKHSTRKHTSLAVSAFSSSAPALNICTGFKETLKHKMKFLRDQNSNVQNFKNICTISL
jgi:hypothetical protein